MEISYSSGMRRRMVWAAGVTLFAGIAVLFPVMDTENSSTARAEQGGLIDPATPPGVAPAGMSPARWRLVFSDEFNDTSVDVHRWNTPDQDRGVKNGAHGFWRPDNVAEHDGSLHIRYREDAACKSCYSSGAADSKGKYSLTYGLIEARVEIIRPDGVQSALWMMPSGSGMSNANCAAGADDGAEIDILEGNSQGARYHTDIHWNGYKDCHAHDAGDISAPALHGDSAYHVFGVDWSASALRFRYDDRTIRTVSEVNRIPDVDEYVRLSGGNFGCQCVEGDISTARLPVSMKVDWIRIYQPTG
ncbi:glycoside hydrolase family 16 protein [Nocardia abscessus]|uniref:glycoside hydrolase family 16 protein n=1 Tax=Nocardia abscessus TaxID=120957 RepID=UPI002458E5B7|nr:glycoside hydrolase family 16 protein [Nocardia abscessus]